MAPSKLNRMTPSQLRKAVARLEAQNEELGGYVRMYSGFWQASEKEVLFYKRDNKQLRWFTIAMVLLFTILGFSLGMATSAVAHDHDPNASAEQNRVNEFYTRWLQPGYRNAEGNRQVSCCNKTDCSPIVEMKKNGGQWFIRTELGGNTWYVVPDEVWEDNTPELLESPDMRSHACIIGGQVKCAVRASGQ